MATNSFDSFPVVGKILILAGIVGVVGAGYYFAFHVDMTDAIAHQVRRHGELEEEQQEAERRQEEYLRVTEELASREAIDRENKRILPEEAEMASFLQDLNRVAELSGLDIRLVEPRPEEAQPLYIRLPVSLSVSGRFHQLAKFFYNVSQLRRAINMEDITLSEPTITNADEVVLDVDVLATTFRRAPEPVTPAQVPAAGAQ